MNRKNIVIIGGGPAGLMAAEVIAKAGHKVTIYDRMPSLGRKFLMAGRGGLNLTHSENLEKFVGRYNDAAEWMALNINDFPPSALREWCESLGQEVFVGSSGRIFPKAMKAAPLLRAWLQRLEQLGVQYLPRHDWHGWQGDALIFSDAAQQQILVNADATLLALGGASWPRLGSDGSWVKILAEHGVGVSPLRPANCGFNVHWSDNFREKFAGTPLKPVVLTHENISRQGELMITADGIEGGAVYALSANLREAVASNGLTILHLDTRPGISLEALTKKLEMPRGKQSLSSYLRKAGFSALAINLLREVTPVDRLKHASAAELAGWFKALPLALNSTTGLAKAISTAGGITRDSVNKYFMLNAKPGVFIAGEMLDWEAPTGGYLLQGCFSTAVAAANGVIEYLK